MGVLALTIGGAAYVIGTSLYDIAAQWEIAAPANGPARLSCTAVADDAAQIPAIDQEIVLTEDGAPLFGGYIGEPELEGIAGAPTDPAKAALSALDYHVLPARRYVRSLTIPAGTLKAALQAIVPYIDGVTLDAAQVNGPSLPELVYSAWTAEQVLNQLSQVSGGWVWRISAAKVLSMKTPGATAAPFNLAAGDGNTIGDVKVRTIRTANQYGNYVIVQGTGVEAIAQNAGEIASHGRWDLLISAPDTTTQAAADALAAAILAASTLLVKQVEYSTELGGLEPGMTQTINLPTRGVNNTFLITEVRTIGRGPLVTRQVTAIEGVVYRTGWRESVKDWVTGGSGAGVTLPGVVPGTLSQRFAYFLGGSGLDFVQDPTPTWVAASPIQVQVNTIARGSIQALVTARLRAVSAGVSVRARLYDYTAAAACPETSTLVTSTSWQTVSWTVTLNAGSHYYGIQVLPGAADEDVAAVAYLE